MRVEKLKELEPAHNAALIIAVLTAIGSALRVAFYLGYNLRTFELSDQIHRTCCLNFRDSFLIGVTLGLIVTATGLLTRNRIGRIFSMLGLLWAVTVYILWYRATQSVIRNSEVDSFEGLRNQTQYLLPLNRATWWDLAVLAIVILLLAWHLGTSVSIYRSFFGHR